MSAGAAIVARARAMIGVRFRLHGRGADGLDCVGLVAMALNRAGAPSGYALRSGDEARARRWMATAGLRAVPVAQAGDVALVRPGPMQLHVMIGTGNGFVHAHAGIGRVVDMPGPSPWPVIGWWRDGQGGED